MWKEYQLKGGYEEMTIKEVEEITGLTRSNIRFYEKEKMITPGRNDSNGYRNYSTDDVNDIKRIAFLRTLGVSIEDIKSIMNNKVSIHDIISRQVQVLDGQLADIEYAKDMCEKMLLSERLSYEELNVEDYKEDIKEYIVANKEAFKVDTIAFIYLWGGVITWGILAILSLIISIISYSYLPDKIPIQWSDGYATSLVDKIVIFAYPFACVLIRLFLRPYIWQWLQKNGFRSETVTNYLTNFLCFVAVSLQGFTILYVNGYTKYITRVLLFDSLFFAGLLLIGWFQLNKRGNIEG